MHYITSSVHQIMGCKPSSFLEYVPNEMIDTNIKRSVKLFMEDKKNSYDDKERFDAFMCALSLVKCPDISKYLILCRPPNYSYYRNRSKHYSIKYNYLGFWEHVFEHDIRLIERFYQNIKNIPAYEALCQCMICNGNIIQIPDDKIYTLENIDSEFIEHGYTSQCINLPKDFEILDYVSKEFLTSSHSPYGSKDPDYLIKRVIKRYGISKISFKYFPDEVLNDPVRVQKLCKLVLTSKTNLKGIVNIPEQFSYIPQRYITKEICDIALENCKDEIEKQELTKYIPEIKN